MYNNHTINYDNIKAFENIGSYFFYNYKVIIMLLLFLKTSQYVIHVCLAFKIKDKHLKFKTIHYYYTCMVPVTVININTY